MPDTQYGKSEWNRAKELARLLGQFVTEYGQKPLEQSDAEWLAERLHTELPSLDEAACAVLGREAVEAIAEYDENLASLNAARAQGKTTQEWFAQHVQQSGLPSDVLNQQLGEAYTSLNQVNGQMLQDGPVAEAAEAVDWSSCDPRMLAKGVGEQAMLAGLQSAAITTGYSLAEDIMREQPIDVGKTVAAALETGVDTGIKTAAAGALTVAAEHNLVPQLPPGSPIQLAANVACVAVENVKTLTRAADGVITQGEAAEEMGRNAAVLYFDTSFGRAGRVIGKAVGTLVGKTVFHGVPGISKLTGELGGMIGYAAGKAVGKKVRETVEKVSTTAKRVARQAWEGVKNTGRKIASGIKALGRALFG